MSARATAIAVVALLVLGVALIAQAWRMKDYSLNVSIARERQDDDPEMLRNYHRYFGATEGWHSEIFTAGDGQRLRLTMCPKCR